MKDKSIQHCPTCRCGCMPKTEPIDRMFYIKGSKESFKCDCGCNVFRNIEDNSHKHVCNSCGAVYNSE